jgi:thiosulfate/3-mercaptopyruvate sulfurtransferase
MTPFTGPLIDAQRLHVLLAGAHPPLVADCRFALADPAAGEAAYREAHIPSAVYLHLERDLSGPVAANGGRHPLPSPEAFGRTMRRIGLDAGRLVVACDDSRGAFAARLWWLARYFGHERVCVLDGGVNAWIRAGLPLDGAIPAPAAGNFEPSPRAAMRIDYEELAPRVAAGTLALVDSREPRRFAGLEEPIDPVAGHVPGAQNRPWVGATREADGCFLDPAAQAERWRGVPKQELVVYCGSGVTACVNLLSLELAGIGGARLYPGSWSDWCARPGAPIARAV